MPQPRHILLSKQAIKDNSHYPASPKPHRTPLHPPLLLLTGHTHMTWVFASLRRQHSAGLAFLFAPAAPPLLPSTRNRLLPPPALPTETLCSWLYRKRLAKHNMTTTRARARAAQREREREREGGDRPKTEPLPMVYGDRRTTDS